ncbi:unnamed protein product [Acanthoscelides obtectus]|uniref:Uncharacterized protein n=1 Tax=Acanthoscelides obtectus TaxID=200917 RepID=A0A9P0PP73_ACAOB|nr:unnamed protein product [Acanthoscelides obtectus]CAK1624840.1 hypothetical protein AOBTE_LOCUS2794 [Acanthoscelides obtectus]
MTKCMPYRRTKSAYGMNRIFGNTVE